MQILNMRALFPSANDLIRLQLMFMFFLSNSIYLTAQQKVVGGVDVDIQDYPWQVAVDYGCGGSIIGDSWVLTAAHCVNGGVNYIYAGNSAPYASGGESYSVSQVIVHPNYGSGTSYSHDFALIEINGEFNFDNANIGKIDLITPGEVLAGSEDPGVTTTITGWGTLSSGGAMASTLQMVEAPLVANDVACGAATDSNGNSGDYSCSSLNASMVCAGDLINGGEDACQGDSGGPLAVRSVLDNRWLLIGATSWGYGCANVNYPGVWSRVSYVYDWITNTADVISYDNDLSVANISIDIANCGSGAIPFVEIANVGSNAISVIEIQLFVDDVFVETIVWQDPITPYETIFVEFSLLNNLDVGSHALEVVIQGDDNQVNNSLSIDFNIHQFITGDINLTLYLDQQPGQISWELLNNNEEVLYNGSGYGIALGVESVSFNLPSESCYTFNIYDSNGSSTSLSYSLSADGTTISGSGFGSSESINFYVGEISGCTNPMASNYNPEATQNDGSCVLLGCTNSEAYNYNAEANQDDGSCLFYGCMDPSALNYNFQATDDDDSCEYFVVPNIFDYELTGSNHTIVIPGDVEFNLLDGPISNTDLLGVFYTDENGVEHCGGYIVWEGTINSIAAQGDDLTTDEIDGFPAGMAFNFKIWDYSEGLLFDCNVTYSSVMPNQGSFVTNGISSVTMVQALPPITSQDIIFPDGWGIFSTYIQSENMDIMFLLNDIQSNIIIVKDYMGVAYLPDWDYNGIGEIEYDQGYQIKTTQACFISIHGEYIDPEDHYISLENGWNMISYLRVEPAAADLVFSELVLEENLVIAKDATGAAYLPAWDYNGIGDLEPGKGYLLKTNFAGELIYFSNSLQYE